MPWEGIVNYGRRLFYGSKQAPRLKQSLGSEAPGTEAKSFSNEDYKWFRLDELVRRCIVINAAMATMSAGFDTCLEPTGEFESEDEKQKVADKYADVKAKVDEINKKVNLDKILFVSQIKRSIYGSAGWELAEIDSRGYPQWLLSLQSEKLKPEVEPASWKITSYEYNGVPKKYPSDEILFFENLQLERTTADNRGLSDVEPIRSICQARHDLLDDFAEIVKTMWAGNWVVQVDTAGMSVANENTYMNALNEGMRSGKLSVINKAVTLHGMDVKINAAGLVNLLDKFEEAIMRAFGTPRFLLNRPIENRACYSEDTETLTENGWKHYWEVESTEKIATFNPENGLIEYHVPKKLYVYDYKGEMIHFVSNQQDILVTPEHKMWHISDRLKGKFRKIKANALMKLTRANFITAGEWIGVIQPVAIIPGAISYQGNVHQRNEKGQFTSLIIGESVRPDTWIPMDTYLDFVGYYLSEGGALSPEKSKYYKQYSIAFAQKDPAKTALMKACFDEMKYNYSIYPDSEDPQLTRFTFHDKSLWTHMVKTYGYDCTNKHVPSEIFQLSKKQLARLLNALMLGDGTKDKRPNRRGFSYTTVSSQLADDVQRLAIHLGYYARIDKRTDKRKDHKRHLQYRIEIHPDSLKAVSQMEKKSYNGKVYCFEVKNHLFITRRNGCPTIQGNTAYAELEAYVQGPVANIQRYFKRELETKWYDMLTRAALKEFGVQGDELPVRVVHRWRPIRAADIYEMGKTVAQLYGQGMGLLAEFPEIGFDLMGFDKKILDEWRQKFEPPEA